jgi:hypothetical protein
MSEVTSVNGKTGAVVLTAANVEAVPGSEVGQANGVASLNSSGVLPEAQLPSSVVTSKQVRTSESLGNTAVGVGALVADTTGVHNTAIGEGA